VRTVPYADYYHFYAVAEIYRRGCGFQWN